MTKVRNVENAGGKVALIVNNDDMNISRIIMSDDGTGRDITIPALLVSKNFILAYNILWFNFLNIECAANDELRTYPVNLMKLIATLRSIK